MKQRQLEEVTVGKIIQNKAIVIQDYDNHWPVSFQEEAAKISAILGQKIIQLEHVGSTSIPGLAAKPIIDILLVVADSANEESYLPDLEKEGYSLKIREPDWFEHRMFKGPKADIHLHVFSQNCSEIQEMLRFRDWLKISAEDRNRYQRLKKELATKNWTFVQDYADSKTPLINEIKERARIYFQKKS